MDANAGQRAIDRRRDEEKVVAFQQEGIKYHNRETTFKRGIGQNVLGYTRDLSDAYAAALSHIGKGRAAIEDATKAFLASKAVDEGGRAVKFGLRKYQALLQKKSEVDSVIDNVLGRNMAYVRTGAQRKLLAANAANREALGLPAMYGAPVMLTPTNRLGGALQIGTQALSIAASLHGLGAFGGSSGPLQGFGSNFKWPKWLGGPSDRKLKENIDEVGISPQGYKVYEFSYKGDRTHTRYRGTMAHDVVKINPMAVGIHPDGYLTVDYDQIDVDMEVV